MADAKNNMAVNETKIANGILAMKEDFPDQDDNKEPLMDCGAKGAFFV